jgi:hypothetical protein
VISARCCAERYFVASRIVRPAAREARGRGHTGATSAKTCVDGISYPQQCGTFWQTDPVFPQACDVTLVGKIADGGTCVSIFDCASITSYCDEMTKRFPAQ